MSKRKTKRPPLIVVSLPGFRPMIKCRVWTGPRYTNGNWIASVIHPGVGAVPVYVRSLTRDGVYRTLK